MRFLLKGSLCFIVYSGAALLALDCAADRRLPALEFGMGYRDVIQSWGPPSEKQEFEAKREDVWLYRGGKVFFRDGKIVAWTKDEDGEELVELAADNLGIPEKNVPVPIRAATDPEMVQEILKKIMEEGEAEAVAGPPTKK